MKSHKSTLAAMLATAALLLVQQASGSQDEQPSPEPYSFSYSAESFGAVSSRQESGDGSGRVTGFYTVVGDDGRERRVDYVADENGYRASIKTNEVGTRAGSSADAQYEVQLPSAQQLEAAKVSYEQYKYLEDAHASATQQAQQQLQQAARRTAFATSGSGLSSDQQERVSGWRQRQQLNLNKRELSLDDQTSLRVSGGTKGAQIGYQPQRQRGPWQGIRQQNSVLQQQLEQQFVAQANQLGQQDYLRQQVQPGVGFSSADKTTTTTTSFANQIPQVSVQPQQQGVTIAQQQQPIGGGFKTPEFGQQFVSQQQSNIVNEVPDQQEYATVTEDEQEQQQQQLQQQQQVIKQQSAFNKSISSQPNGFAVINLSENDEQRGYEQNVRPATPFTEAPQRQPAIVIQQEQVRDQVQKQVVTQAPYTVGSILINEDEQKVSTWRPNSVNQIISGINYQQQQDVGRVQSQVTTRPSGLVMRPLTTSTTTPAPTTLRPETTTATIYYQPTTTRIDTTTRKPFVAVTSSSFTNLNEVSGITSVGRQQQQQQFTGVKGGSRQRTSSGEITRPVGVSWDQQLVANRQPTTEFPSVQQRPAVTSLTSSWQSQSPNVIRLESGSPRVEYLNNNNNQTSTTGARVVKVVKQQGLVTLKGTKGGSLSTRRAKQFWQQTQVGRNQPATSQNGVLQSATATGYAAFGSRRSAGRN